MAETLKSRMKADIVWNQIIRGRFQASFQFSDKDIQTRLTAKNPEGATTTVSYDYTLRPILFVCRAVRRPRPMRRVPRKPKSCAGQFQNCEEGVVLARGARFVAVRPPVVKELRRTAGAASRHPDQNRNGQAHAAGDDAAGCRGLRGLRPQAVRQRARKERNARPDVQRDVRRASPRRISRNCAAKP